MGTRKPLTILLIMWVIFSLYGCGGSPSQPSQPPPQPTALPEPSATPPPPFNLVVKVIDPQSAPLSGAMVEVAGKKMTSSANGTAAFSDLGSENVDIKVDAAGYISTSQKKALTRGDNTEEVKLAENPYGLLPANACAPGEKLLYIEDFQGGIARQWDAVENKTPGWTVELDPKNPQNLVMAARKGVGWAWLGGRETYKFNNAIWRIHYKFLGSGNSHFNFRFVESSDLVRRYLLPLNNNTVNLLRFQPDNQVEVGQVGKSAPGEWHLLEIGYFDGEVFTFLDGKKGINWKDPNPWKDGTVNLEPYPEADAVFFYDNISVCELSAAPVPLPSPKTGYNLSVVLKGVDGAPVASGGVKIAELGSQEMATQQSDESGKVSWVDLPGTSVTVQVSAAGYKPFEKKLDLKKGENDLEASMERDPLRKLASKLCLPGETLLYSEDFQSGLVNGWSALSQKLKLNIPGVSIADDPEIPGNKILLFQGQSDGEHSEAGWGDEVYGDAVFRYDFKMTGNIHQHLGWHRGENRAGYLAFIYGKGGNGGRLDKCVSDEAGGPCQMVDVATWRVNVADGKWQRMEISTYQGEVQLWLNEKKLVKWIDPQPVAEGAFSFAHDFWKANSSAVYDNFAVCGLKAPFVTMPVSTKKP